MARRQIVERETPDKGKPLKGRAPKTEPLFLSRKEIRQLIGTKAFEGIEGVNPDRTWTVERPAKKSREDAYDALRKGNYTFLVTERAIFVTPTFE